MEKPIQTYKYLDSYIEKLPYFLYEVSLYKITPNVKYILCSKYYKSDILLKVKECEVVRKFKDCIVERFITLLGAPQSFIEENNLPIYEKRKN